MCFLRGEKSTLMAILYVFIKDLTLKSSLVNIYF